MIAFGLLPLGADQRANAIGLAADGIQRIEAGELDIEFGLGILVEQLQRPPRSVVPLAVGIAGIAADALEMRLQQTRAVAGIHRGRRRRGWRHRLVRRQRRDLRGLLLAFALRLVDLGLRVGHCLTPCVLDLLPRGFRLLLRLFEFAPGVVELLLGLFGNLLAGLFEILLGLLGQLLLGVRGLPRALFFKLLAEIRRFLRRLLLGLPLCIVGLGAALLRGQQLCVLAAGKVGKEAIAMLGQE